MSSAVLLLYPHGNTKNPTVKNELWSSLLRQTDKCVWYDPPPDPTVKSSIPSNTDNSHLCYSFQLGTNLLASHNLVLPTLASAAEHFSQFYLDCKHVDTLRPSTFQLYTVIEDLLLLQPVLWYVAITNGCTGSTETWTELSGCEGSTLDAQNLLSNASLPVHCYCLARLERSWKAQPETRSALLD